MKMNLGGLVPLSTSDYSGKASFVVFFRTCPYRCPNCHNEHLQTGSNIVDTSEIKKAIQENYLISAVLCSGGECTAQPDALLDLARCAKTNNKAFGIESSGAYPKTLRKLISEGLLDKLFLDIKAELQPADYDQATGHPVQHTLGFGNLAALVKSCIRICQDKCEIEFRTTVFPHHRSNLIPMLEHILIDLTNLIDTPCTWRLQIGIPKDKTIKPLAKEELQEYANQINSLFKSHINLVVGTGA
jgi:pyruvate formate lyase activating enzyme